MHNHNFNNLYQLKMHSSALIGDVNLSYIRYNLTVRRIKLDWMTNEEICNGKFRLT